MNEIIEWFKGISISSAIMGVVIAGLFQRWQKKLEYKSDYYKKIVDKRLSAYEKLEQLLGNLAVTKEILNELAPQRVGTGHIIFYCFDNKSNLEKALDNVNSVLNNRIWYTPYIQQNLTELNLVFVKALTTLEYPSEDNLSMYNLRRNQIGDYLIIKIGMAVTDNLDRIFRDIELSIRLDIKKLHDVDNFL